MTDPDTDTIKVLNDLIDVCEDGRKGFETAAESVKDVRYKDLFRRNSRERARLVTELQAEVQRLGGKPDDSGTAAGTLHRGWINLRTAVTSKDERAVLEECERGEDHAVKVFRDALAKPLPETARVLVARQAADVQRAHDSMRSLRDTRKEVGQY
jgi:uncharacterized protein (TIGR02284 family)